MGNLLTILAIVTFVGVLRKIYKIFKQQAHLTDEDLMTPRYFMPRSPEYNRIIEHLSTCNKCAERMEYLNSEMAHLVDEKDI